MRIKSLLYLGLIILLLSSCDKVEEPYIEEVTFDCIYGASDLPVRKFLIEDFTGWNCQNCPQATREIESLIKRYPCHIVAIGVHAGYFGYTTGGPDFTTDVGYELGGDGTNLGFFNVILQPIGVLNRKSWDDEFRVQHTEWEDSIVSFLENHHLSKIGIQIENNYNAESKELSSIITTTAYEKEVGKLSLVVYLTESHIIGTQKDGSLTIEDYEHNHVLRAGLNSTWGEVISDVDSVATNTVFTNNLSLILDNDWVPENCKVIAFISNTETKEIIQVEEHEVIEE